MSKAIECDECHEIVTHGSSYFRVVVNNTQTGKCISDDDYHVTHSIVDKVLPNSSWEIVQVSYHLA